MGSEMGRKIDDLLDRLNNERSTPHISPEISPQTGPTRPVLPSLDFGSRRPGVLTPLRPPESDRKLKEIMKSSGRLKLRGKTHLTDAKDMQLIEELGFGTCGHVVKMKHMPSGEIIAVKQMRRTQNSEENKRIVMDIEVVIKSHGCPYIVQCLGCFIMEAEVWICMELMSTCFDKLMKRLMQPIPEDILGKVTVATVKALAYLKDNHDIIHRDVKPSNILLDEGGNIKLCDFGISGRLVDSMAATKSAGCTAYLAPERIEVDPNNPDYDVRADVWSLGITLVELATGSFPYPDCKTDFEVLAMVMQEDPPTLPADKDFSVEFRQFVKICLTKDKKDRPKYVKLKNEPFYKKYEKEDVNVGEWYVKAIRGPENHESSRQTSSSLRRTMHSRQRSEPPPRTNGDFEPHVPDSPGFHISRITSFQRDSRAPVRTYSPFQAYQEHLQVKNSAEKFTSPLMQRRVEGSYLQKRYNSPLGSPLPLRNHIQPEEQPYNCGNTSPIVLQRFYHQQKQQQQAKEAEEYSKCDGGLGKKRISSYIKLQVSSDRTGRTSRHQSPEPPPRYNRNAGDNQSPLALRRNFFESNASTSPSLSRRYISPTPPVPPPRRLSESTSVPGSPQHLRTRFHYTPEPQRRLFQKDES